MIPKSEIQRLIEIAKKPMTGFSVNFDNNKLKVFVKPKTALFGCLTVFFVAISVFLFFTVAMVPFKYIFALAPVLIGFTSMVRLSKNATQTTFNLSERSLCYENSNFIGKIFNKPVKLNFSDVTAILCREETITNNSSSNGTTSRNFVFKIYLANYNLEYQLLTVNKGVLNFEEIEEFAGILKKIIG